MNRARTFAPSAEFAAMTVTLASQLADLETADGADEIADPLCNIWSATEKDLIQKPAEAVGDVLLKIEILARVAEDSVVTRDEWRALGRDVEIINGAGLSFIPEAWLRRWTGKGGGYVRTDAGLSFVTPEPATFQQRLLLDELARAQGHRAVADFIDGAREPTLVEWVTLRHAFTDASDNLPGEASDEELDAYWAAWEAAMLGEGSTTEAIRWKVGQLVSQTLAMGSEFTNDEELMDAIISDVERYAGKGGAK